MEWAQTLSNQYEVDVQALLDMSVFCQAIQNGDKN